MLVYDCRNETKPLQQTDIIFQDILNKYIIEDQRIIG